MPPGRAGNMASLMIFPPTEPWRPTWMHKLKLPWHYLILALVRNAMGKGAIFTHFFILPVCIHNPDSTPYSTLLAALTSSSLSLVLPKSSTPVTFFILFLTQPSLPSSSKLHSWHWVTSFKHHVWQVDRSTTLSLLQLLFLFQFWTWELASTLGLPLSNSAHTLPQFPSWSME